MVELKIPNKWAKVNISDIADVDLGKTPKKSDYLSMGDYKVIKFRDVDYSGIDWSNDKDGFVGISSVGNLRELKLHDVLITASAHSAEHIGKKICFVAKLPKDYLKIYFCGELLGISSRNDFLSPKYCFYYFLSHTGFKEIQSHVKGVHLTSGQARNMSIPFTTLPEQNRIIEIVEELFSDLDNAIENLKKAQKQLKIYRHSVLRYAFVGKLTGIKISDFISCTIDSLANVGTGATPKRGHLEYYENGVIPWITSACVNEDLITNSDENITDLAIKETNCKIFPKGSLVVAMYGEGKTRGKVSELGINAATNQACAILVIKNEEMTNKDYLKYFLKNQYLTMRAKASGGVQPNLNLSIIKKLTVHIPKKLKEQQRIVNEIESRFSVCDKMEESINENLQKAEALRQSILKQAFEGKLTEQWRKEHKDLISGENSAEALLEKIKAEKEILQANLKGKKKYGRAKI